MQPSEKPEFTQLKSFVGCCYKKLLVKLVVSVKDLYVWMVLMLTGLSEVELIEIVQCWQYEAVCIVKWDNLSHMMTKKHPENTPQ
jgi:hypothetical protein